MNNNFSQLLENPEWFWDYERMYIRPNIPHNKLLAAINSYAKDASPNEVLVLLDDTVFGGSKEGVLIAEKAMYSKALFEEPKKIRIENIVSIEPDANSRFNVNGQEFYKATLIEHFAMLALAYRLASVLEFPPKPNSTKAQKSETPNKNSASFLAFFSILGKMTKVNNGITKNQSILLNGLMEDMNLNSEEKKIAENVLKNTKKDHERSINLDDPKTIYHHANDISKLAEPHLLEVLYAILWDLALADGIPSDNESKILRSITSNLGISDDLYYMHENKNSSSESTTLDEHYKVLDCTASDTIQTIKQKYRKFASEYHPDKIQSKGLHEGFQKFATEQMQKINTAYETIMATREKTERDL